MVFVIGIVAAAAVFGTSFLLGLKLRMPQFLMPGPNGYRDMILLPPGLISVPVFLFALYGHSGWLGLSSLMLGAVSLGLWSGIRKSLGY